VYATLLVFADETAIIPNQLWAEFEDSVLPTISSAKTSRVAYTSTPKGFNHFFQICEDARNRVSDFVYFEAKWLKPLGVLVYATLLVFADEIVGNTESSNSAHN
jgi:hypothetical protein